MGILGLTDRPARLTRIGTLRKGEPKRENGPGRDLDHFRFDTDDAEAAQIFLETYGDMPREIVIMLPHPSTEDNFEAWKESYTAGGMKCRCDGQTCHIWQDDLGMMRGEPIPCMQCPDAKATGRLEVILPDLGRWAAVTVLTTSINDVVNLTSELRSIEEDLRKHGKDLRGIPFILKRIEQPVSTPVKKNGKPTGKRTRHDKWMLHIEPHPDWFRKVVASRMLEATGDGAAQALPQQRPALPESASSAQSNSSTVVDAPAPAKSRLTVAVQHLGVANVDLLRKLFEIILTRSITASDDLSQPERKALAEALELIAELVHPRDYAAFVDFAVKDRTPMDSEGMVRQVVEAFIARSGWKDKPPSTMQEISDMFEPAE